MPGLCIKGTAISTLVEDVLYRAMARKLGRRLDEPPGAHRDLEGAYLFDDVLLTRTRNGTLQILDR